MILTYLYMCFSKCSFLFVTMQRLKILTFQRDIVNLFGNAMSWLESFTFNRKCYCTVILLYLRTVENHILYGLNCTVLIPCPPVLSNHPQPFSWSLVDCLSSALLATFRMCFSVIVSHFLIWHNWALLRSRRILISMNQ